MRFTVAALSSVLFTVSDARINNRETLTQISEGGSGTFYDRNAERERRRRNRELREASSSSSSSSSASVKQTDVYKKLQDRLLTNKLKNTVNLEEAEKCVPTNKNKKQSESLDFGALDGSSCSSKDQVCVDGICVDRASVPEKEDPGSSLLLSEKEGRRLVTYCEAKCGNNRDVIGVNGEDLYYQIRLCLGLYDDVDGTTCKYQTPIDCWDVSQVTDMSGAFFTNYYSESKELYNFNADLQCWDTSNVQNFDSMFYAATKFNGNIDNWDTSSATDMQYMFTYAEAFNRNISTWNTANVMNMTKMFSFSQNSAIGTGFDNDISLWNVENVQNMYGMFEGSKFNGNLEKWKAKKVTDMSYMFDYNQAFNKPLKKFGKSLQKVETMYGMFYNATAFEGKKGLKLWKTKKLTDTSSMFSLATKFKGTGIEKMDVSKVTSMYAMFYKAEKFQSNKLNKWNTGKVTDMASMFEDASLFGKKNPKISTWNVEKVEYFDYQFQDSRFKGDLDPWKMASAKSASFMFEGISGFDQCLSTWASKIPDDATLTDMFKGTGCPIQTTPVPGTGPFCQGTGQGCTERTFANTCQGAAQGFPAPYDGENDQRCVEGCKDIKKKSTFSGVERKIKCVRKKCNKPVKFFEELNIPYSNFCANTCATCLNF